MSLKKAAGAVHSAAEKAETVASLRELSADGHVPSTFLLALCFERGVPGAAADPAFRFA